MLEGLGATVRVGEDGAEGFAKVVKIAPSVHTRLVAVTSVRDDATLVRAWAAGFDAYLEKPVTHERLETLAMRFLSGPHSVT